MKVLTEKMGFKRSRADPCFLMKQDPKRGPILFFSYVDDCVVMGTPEGRAWFKAEIRKHFSTKDANPLTDYVGVTIHRTEKGFILHQDDLLARMEKDFIKSLEHIKSCDSPMKPGYTIKRPEEGEELLSPTDQRKYRSGVGSLNYLVKHTRPDLCNAVRELSKVLNGATEQHLQDLYRVLKYVLYTKHMGFPIEPTFIPKWPDLAWLIEAWTDSDYANDRDNRKSVSAHEVYANGVLVVQKSRLQKTVALSSCEAEYMAAAEACSAILHLKQVLESMGVTIQYPIPLYMDNQGAIFLTTNESTTRTKHIDVRYHFLRELTEGPNPLIKVKYCPTHENRADVHTKNVPVHVFRTAFHENRLKSID